MPATTKNQNIPTQRKNPKKPVLNSLNISTDYNHMSNLSPNISQFAALSTKIADNTSLARSLINQGDSSKLSLEEGQVIGR